MSAAPAWMGRWLRAAAFYNVAWGSWVILAPDSYFRWLGMELPRYPELWQCIGMIVGVYGLGYAAASRDPLRHWPIVAVGLAGKILGPIGFVMGIVGGGLPPQFGWTLPTNDLVWWIPFAMILWEAWREASRPAVAARGDLEAQLEQTLSSHRRSLAEHSWQAPQLVVFLRHFGCTFCREALSELSRQREPLRQQGTELMIVHMGSAGDGDRVLASHGLVGVAHVSDPQARLYRAFRLERGSFGQLFGWRSWWRGLRAGVLERHGLGRPVGDGFQMPGVFLLHCGEVVREYRHAHASDAPDYLEMGVCPVPEANG